MEEAVDNDDKSLVQLIKDFDAWGVLVETHMDKTYGDSWKSFE